MQPTNVPQEVWKHRYLNYVKRFVRGDFPVEGFRNHLISLGFRGHEVDYEVTAAWEISQMSAHAKKMALEKLENPTEAAKGLK